MIIRRIEDFVESYTAKTSEGGDLMFSTVPTLTFNFRILAVTRFDKKIFLAFFAP